MAGLERLLITECPAAFAAMARKHNALVELIASMKGTSGCSVVVSENNIVVKGPLPITSADISNFTAAAAGAAPVQSVAGRTGAVTLSTTDVSGFTAAAAAAAPVQSVNGQTGAVSLTVGVSSVNGETGAVTITAGDISDFNSAASAAAPVQSVNGQTGAVSLAVGVSMVAGKTGNVTLVPTDITDFAAAVDTRISEIASVDVLNSDSKIAKVLRHPANYVTPTAYPSLLKVVAAAGNITLDTTGIEMLKLTGGYTATFAFASLARNLFIDNLDACANGNLANIDTFVSNTYA